MRLKKNARDLTKQALELVEICNASIGVRADAYQQYGQWIENGAVGTLALANMMFAHIDRLSSHLFSPNDLRFTIDFENHYDKVSLSRASMAARVITREWERRNIDINFGSGVKEAVSYGACLLKQIVQEHFHDETGRKEFSHVSSRLVMPWQFGVYNESVNSLGDQEAIVETVYLTEHEVWRRISHLPDAEKLFRRIKAHARKGENVYAPSSFMHQVLSTAIIDVSGSTAQRPGGIVNLSNGGIPILGPQVEAALVPMYEIWPKDDDRNGDYTTIQIIAPDILIAPLFKHCNLFVPDCNPYTLIQPNIVAGYFWGRSEVVDLMMLQQFLTTLLNDGKNIIGTQVDKILAFPGYDGMTDEAYAQFKSQGYMGMPPGSDVKDLTPKLPEQLVEVINLTRTLMQEVSGFSNIMSGQGESGVRAGVHADTLLKTSSPRLRDRAIITERQCSEAGDTTLSVMEAKEAKAFWTEPGKEEESSFLLNTLHHDRRVSVDSHSTSPIYQDDHQQLVAFLVKAGALDGEAALEMLPIPNKDLLIQRLRERQAQQQAMVQQLMQTDPTAAAKLLSGKRR